MKKLLIIPILFATVICSGQYPHGGGMPLRTGSSFMTASTVSQVDTYCDEYDTILAAFDTEPHDTIKTIQNALVYSLDTAGYWDRMDIFYVFASNTENNSLLNWKNPGTYNAYFEGSGQTFVQYEGITDNGGLITTIYNPAIHASAYNLNSASIGVYFRISNTSVAYTGIAIDDYVNATVIRPYGYVNCMAVLIPYKLDRFIQRV